MIIFKYNGNKCFYHNELEVVTCNYKMAPYKYNVVTCNYKMAPCNYNVVTCNYKMTPCNYNVVTCNYKMAPCNYNAVTCNFKMAPCNYNVVTCNYKMAPCNYNLVTCNYNVVPKFGLPGQATNAKKDILMRKNTSCMNYKRRTLLLTDSVLSKTHERSLQNFSRNEFCIKKTMYNLSDIDGFEPEFQYTNTVVIAAGINDLSRQYHTPNKYVIFFSQDLNDIVVYILILCSLFVPFLEWPKGTPV